MSKSGSQEHMRARSAALAGQIDTMMDELYEKTETLARVQREIASTTAQAHSKDGRVTVEVDASGAVSKVQFAPDSFTRSTPQKLAQTVAAVAREAAIAMRAKIESLLAPVTAASGMMDLPELIPGAPSLRDLMPPPITIEPSTDPTMMGEPDDDELGWNQNLLGGHKNV